MYVTNKLNHFFVVETSINTEKLIDCKIHNSLTEMYDYVCKVFNLGIDEIEGLEIYINDSSNVEEYISNYSE